ncbi:uncharacterized protein MJAP1_000069 [Malassezia japonica]|uniref:Cation efflux protein transmembrane domain-containing protein n=1 Tax=Malassezia japonica TaxID=223818 RepID=A0AAF0EYK6_9BASI|nr:uncharacterized protein MJAP1_000069 [Malassezia japonica]WFD37127.1 hypothetical protein MJAP1_000069 [Malassezia japonica]
MSGEPEPHDPRAKLDRHEAGSRPARKARTNAEFVLGYAEESPETSRSRAPPEKGTSVQEGRAPRHSRRFGRPDRNSSEDSIANMPRNDSIRSLQALQHLMDHRSGYYEEARKDSAALNAMSNPGLREFYEEQNEVLDGWREVDEVLESQFPMEVMRRFSVPTFSMPHFRPELFLSSRRNVTSPRQVEDDDGYATDEESDSIWTHPFSHNSHRRQRRISERALTSLSGFFNMEQNALARSMASVRSDTGPESSPERAIGFGQHIRQSHDASKLVDLQEEGDGAEMKDEPKPTEGTPLMANKRDKQDRSLVRQVLSANPAVTGIPATEQPENAEAALNGAAAKTRDMVWTKADRDRNDLLQNVPTHQRKLDSDSFVQMYINVNLAINFVLVLGKVVAVFSSNSVSLMASLVDSALDLLCTVVIFMTSKATAYRSWNTFYKYPVGKRRLEPLGVLIFSVLMVVSFLQVLLESINRLLTVMHHKYGTDSGLPPIGIFFMVLTIVIKSVMWVWCRHSKNSSVRAIAQDSENDVMFNIFSLVFPMLDKYLGWHVLDPIGGGLLSLYIISEWVATLADTTSKLTGKVASAQDVSRCLYLVSRFSLVQAISGFELYHAGDTMVAEVDVVLPLSFQLKEAHDLGEIITYCIESLSGIERAYIHLDYNPAGQSGHIGQRG